MFRRLFERLRRRPERANPLAFQPRAGQLVSVVTSDGGYGVAKLLAVDDVGVHARLYVQRFATRPSEEELQGLELALAPFGPGHTNAFSIGHMPLSHATFAGWEPHPICTRAVADAELEGYGIWEEGQGGYF